MNLQSIRNDVRRLRSEIESVERRHEIIIWFLNPNGTRETSNTNAPSGPLTEQAARDHVRRREAAGFIVHTMDIAMPPDA